MASPIVPLNLPKAELQLSQNGKDIFVVCLIRRKKIVLTPEEWVRQHLLNYFIQQLSISKALIAVEYPLQYNGLSKRCDIVIFDNMAKPKLIVECKAPDISLSEKVYHQIASYNSQLNVDQLLVSNGLDHFVCKIDQVNHQIQYFKGLDGVTF